MLAPEIEDGNIEYKSSLLNVDNERKENLITQMRRRCIEGNGECVYILGVEDNGVMTGLTDNEYDETIQNIKILANKNNYFITLLSKKETEYENKFVYEVLIREKNDDKYIDIKVAVAGGVDSGKTTLVGCLISGEKDNGRGLARSHVFVYPHELQTGRTSAISHQIIGYDHEGKIVNYQGLGKLSWQEIVQKSSKIISILDLAGHEKYLKTTILGLTSSFPDVCMIIVDANNGIKPMTKEHILLCVTLKIPFIIVVTKIDICKDRPNILQETKQSINRFLKYPGIRRLPFNIKSEDDILTSIKNIYTESITPIFYVSNTTGEGVDHLKYFFNIINKKNPTKLINDFVEFHIDHTFSVYGFGLVLGGHLTSGSIKIGDKLLIGPNNGEYENVVVRSIYCKKMPLQYIQCGSYVCLGIKKIDKNNIIRGNVIISTNAPKLSIKTFVGRITVLKAQSTTIRIGYEPVFHCCAIRQVVKILQINDKKNSRNVSIDDECLRNGDSANIVFTFKYTPQYIKIGSRFLLCEGKTKVMGEVIDVL
jgi:GTPase